MYTGVSLTVLDMHFYFIDGLLEAYWQLVCISDKIFFDRQFSPLPKCQKSW